MASFGYQVLGFGSNAVSGPAYVEATGGDATITSGDYKIHVFTGDGNLCVTSKGAGSGSDTVDYMVVAGGGGSGTGTGGGGGAGGFRQSPGTASGCYAVSPLGASPAVAIPVSTGALPITVGGGGTAAPCGPGTPYRSSPGGDSVFQTITSTGGGGGNYGDGNDPLGPVQSLSVSNPLTKLFLVGFLPARSKPSTKSWAVANP